MGVALSFLCGFFVGAIVMLVAAAWLTAEADKMLRQTREYEKNLHLPEPRERDWDKLRARQWAWLEQQRSNVMPFPAPKRERSDERGRLRDSDLSKDDGQRLEDRTEWNEREVEKRGEREDDSE